MSTRVLCIWDVPAALRAYLSDALGSEFELIFPASLQQDELISLAAQADIIIGWRPTAALLDAAHCCRIFINPGAGVQHCAHLFAQRDITLINGHGNAGFTAQHAVALLLSLTNKIVVHHEAMQAGQWRMGDSLAASIPLRNRHIGLLGYGHVNTLVHRFLSGFDCQFSLCNRSGTLSRIPPTPVTTYATHQLHQFLSTIDILIACIPATEQTNGMIGETELELLGSSGLLVTIARGSVIQEEALFNALTRNTISAAAIDVWYNYSPAEDAEGRRYPFHKPFHTLSNVILSPHRAASPFSDLARWDEVIENITRFHNGDESLLNVVDIDAGY